MLVLASCEPDVPVDPREPTASPSGTDVPAGGSVTFGVLGEPPALDPYSKLASDLTFFLARPVYRSLYRVGPDGVVEPDLVSSLDAETGGVVVEIEATTWSDGKPVTARDVVRSIERARDPSSFAGMDARVVGRRRIHIAGAPGGDWARRLSVGTYVVPRRADLKIGAGPFVVSRYEPGLEIVYEPNPRWEGDRPNLDRITAQFISSTGTMLGLLERGDLDAAAPPSAVNLDDRLDEMGLLHAETRGWETIAFDLDEAPEGLLRSSIVGAIDREHIAEGLLRDDGRVLGIRAPDKRLADPGVEIQLGTASGDELLQLMQRIMQRDLSDAGIKAELAQVDPATLYGPWESDSPVDVSLRREIAPGFGGPRVPRDLSWFPLFSVDTFLAWREGVGGLEPNGGLDGPLWNAERWWKE